MPSSLPHTLAYHRFGNGGPRDVVVVVVNLSAQRLGDLDLLFPRAGTWRVRFNSGAHAYDDTFVDGESFDTVGQAGSKDVLNFQGQIGIGPYSVVILSQN